MKFIATLLFATLSLCSAAQVKVPLSSLDTSSLQTFAKVEVESEFPGGLDGWRDFLVNNLRYPNKAMRRGIQGTVVVQFIVDKDGTPYAYEAISGPTELRQAAVDVIKKSPKWIPAQQGGKNVKSYKKQPIVFRL